MISYAQNYEDVMLARAFKGRTDGFYVDVGAMDPTEGSVTKFFYDLGWHGVNVEPDSRFHQRLITERPRDINLNVALGETQSELPFYELEAQGISTFDVEHRDYFIERGVTYRVRKQPVTTLAAICETHVRTDIDFLMIDAEGWEGPIVRGGDWKKFRPIVLVLEATKPYSHTPVWDSWEPEVLAAGYCMVYYDGLNRFYVRDESLKDIQEAFAFPPNVLDGFSQLVTIQARQERDRFEQQLASERNELAGAEREIERLRGEYRSLSEGLARASNEIVELRAATEALELKVMDTKILAGTVSQEKAAYALTVERLRAELQGRAPA
jgi:FkbM family methyltransferase